jgi:hypothetical protein
MLRRMLLCFALCAVMALAGPALDGEMVSFSTPSKIGTTVLQPGLYRLKLQGAVLFLTDPTTKKSISVIVKVEKTVNKSSFTAAQGRTIDGIQLVETILLQGADYKLIF